MLLFCYVITIYFLKNVLTLTLALFVRECRSCTSFWLATFLIIRLPILYVPPMHLSPFSTLFNHTLYFAFCLFLPPPSLSDFPCFLLSSSLWRSPWREALLRKWRGQIYMCDVQNWIMVHLFNVIGLEKHCNLWLENPDLTWEKCKCAAEEPLG